MSFNFLYRESDDYKTLLKDHFQSKKNKNAQYSLRAFAKDLEISPSRLSEVFTHDHMHLSIHSAE